MGKTMIQRLNKGEQYECVFCYEDMLPGDRVCQLACHEKHQFHEGCYNNFTKHFEANSSLLLCPLCRTPVDKDAVIKKELAKPFDSTLKVDDAFQLQAMSVQKANG